MVIVWNHYCLHQENHYANISEIKQQSLGRTLRRRESVHQIATTTSTMKSSTLSFHFDCVVFCFVFKDERASGSWRWSTWTACRLERSPLAVAVHWYAQPTPATQHLFTLRWDLIIDLHKSKLPSEYFGANWNSAPDWTSWPIFGELGRFSNNPIINYIQLI